VLPGMDKPRIIMVAVGVHRPMDRRDFHKIRPRANDIEYQHLQFLFYPLFLNL